MSNKIINLKMIHLGLTIICSFYVSNLWGQLLKTYKGGYDDGSATYTYYEDNEFNRIFQGDFIYSVVRSVVWCSWLFGEASSLRRLGSKALPCIWKAKLSF